MYICTDWYHTVKVLDEIPHKATKHFPIRMTNDLAVVIKFVPRADTYKVVHDIQ